MPEQNISRLIPLTIQAHSDRHVYFQKNPTYHIVGDCKNNTERLLQFFQLHNEDISALFVVFMKRLGGRLPITKTALRKEERSFQFRDVIRGIHSSTLVHWRYHVLILDAASASYDLSCKKELIGSPFQTYIQTILSLKTEEKEALLDQVALFISPAVQYLQEGTDFPFEHIESRFGKIRVSDFIDSPIHSLLSISSRQRS